MLLAGPAALVSAAATLRPGRGTRRPARGKGRLFLHIGTHKTGTTLIQNALVSHAAALADQGVFCPNGAWSFGGDPWRVSPAVHFGFAAALADASDQSRPRLEAFRDRLAEALGRSRAVVLSAESMYRHVLLTLPPGAKPSEDEKRAGREAYLQRLAEFLDGFDPEIIIYFRRPDSFAESLYQEGAAKGLVSYPFRRFLDRDVYRFDYGFQLDLLRKRFPVHAFGFEDAARHGLLAHFLGVLGAEIDGESEEDARRASVPKRAAQWLVRHAGGSRSTLANRRRHASRWLFGLQERNRALFAAPNGAGFWHSDAQRSAFLRRALDGFDAVTFAAPSPVIALPEWTDEEDRRAEAEFAAWRSRHRMRLLLRELGRVPPYIAPELG